MRRAITRGMVPVVLAVTGLIHVFPLLGALGADRLAALYGVVVDDPSLQLLLRHRAVLFGMLGVFLLAAALKPAWHRAALGAGWVSVTTFLVLAWLADSYNPQIARIVAIDQAVLFLLALGTIAHVICSVRLLRGDEPPLRRDAPSKGQDTR